MHKTKHTWPNYTLSKTLIHYLQNKAQDKKQNFLRFIRKKIVKCQMSV